VFRVGELIDFATVTYQGGQYGKKRARFVACEPINELEDHLKAHVDVVLFGGLKLRDNRIRQEAIAL
jgi:hypothetical protein